MYFHIILPVNLTLVSPDIDKVGLMCFIGGDGLVLPPGAIPGGIGNPLSVPASSGPTWVKLEWPVMNGQVVQTFKVAIPISADYLSAPLGKTAQYGCMIGGFSKSLQRWEFFASDHATPSFRLAPTPQLNSGTFVW